MDPSASLNPNRVGDSDSSVETVDSVYSTLYVYRYRHHPTLSLSLSCEGRGGRGGGTEIFLCLHLHSPSDYEIGFNQTSFVMI